MRIHAQASRQRGAVLLVVLVFSIMATLLVVTNLKDNLVQERLAGNFQKQLNARYTAEQGMYESYNRLKARLKTHPKSTLENLKDALPGRANGKVRGSHFETRNHRIPAPGLLMLASRGHHLEGAAGLNVAFALQAIPGNEIYEDAVVACEGISLKGSGTIDSYDSGKGAYGDNNKGRNANVGTISANADVILDGHSPIEGNVRATGDVSLKGSSPVSGNVHASGDVIISSGSGLRVDGNIRNGGDFSLNGGIVSGSVHTNGNALMDWSTEISSGELLYGGQGTFRDNEDKVFEGADHRVNPNVPEVATSSCDPINMPQVMAKLAGTFNEGPLAVAANDVLDLTPLGSSHENTGNGKGKGGGPIPPMTPRKADVLGDKAPVYRFDSLNMSSNGIINISGGDVTLIVDGDFSMAGDNKLNIAEDSSLTIIVGGKVSLGAGAKVTAQKEGIRDNGKIAMSLYSAYDGADGITISGSTPIYAAMYAPLTDVKLSGSGALYGAVRGKTISASGGSGIHYDEALGLADLGEDHGKPPVLALRDWLWL
ncbi:hypothetical protein VXM60_17655 [Shewanella khirikhana]|uniref:DUF7305 domain-containing protein n=1 Tax=Shewanella khirikhana TaxID=1965282 RepID=UPI0030D51E82